jgi:DNA-binding transcriptional MocR family regulator
MEKTMHPSTPSRLDDVNLRPSERVIQYLLQEFDRPELKEGSRLPSNRELARRLQVSVPTIQGVLQQLSREGRVRAQRGSGTYLISRPSSIAESLKIVIAAPLHPDEGRDPWLHTIFAGLVPAVIKSKTPITLRGISPQEFGTNISVQYLLDERASADGLIVIPFALMPDDRRRVTEAYEEAKKPAVHLHPPEISATANFVSADYMEAAYRLGNAWRQTRRRRILLLGADLKYSITPVD